MSHCLANFRASSLKRAYDHILLPSGTIDTSLCVRSSLQNYLFSSGKTRGYGDLGSYQSSPSGPSPQPPSTVARSSTQSAVPSSPSPVSPGSTLLRQPSKFQQQQANLRGWAPVTPPATSPLPQQHPPFPSQQQQPQQQRQQQQQTQPWQVSDARMKLVADGRPSQFWEKSR